mmetsp:Transcript_44451/g.74151  ORF Transcript_44451/g.74151 Transcript_44451/m.74151 type:complete len:329 (-) Transcript_44451:2589-3575(-)
MERVERHLRGWLADGLRCDRADHLARVDLRLLEPLLDLARQPVECLRGEAVLLQHTLGGERGAQQRGEEEGGVLLRLNGERVLAGDHYDVLAEPAHRLRNLDRIESGDLPGLAGGEGLLRVPDEALNVDRQRPGGFAGRENVRAEDLVVSLDHGVLVLQDLALLGAGAQLLRHLSFQVALPEGRLVEVVAEDGLELALGETQVVELLGLDPDGVHAVLAIQELDHVAHGVAHRAVVLHHHILQRLDQPPLDVPCLRRLHRRVDQPLATAHGVEEELLRGEPSQVRVFHEPAALRAVVVLGEVRQRAVHKPVRDTFPLHVLLAHAGNHL